MDSIWQSTGIMLRFCRKTRMSSTLPSVATMRMGHSAWKSRHPLLIIKLQSKKTGSIRVVNKYGLFHFIFKHGQVSANFDLLLKWFTVFGRDTPTGTELKAQYQSCHCTSQESPPNRSVVAQVAILELNDSLKFLQQGHVKYMKAPLD